MKAGEWWLIEDAYKNGIGISYVCPCGCGERGFIAFARIAAHPVWQWDGNKLEPTVTPAIQKNTHCRWRGHLTKGVFMPC